MELLPDECENRIFRTVGESGRVSVEERRADTEEALICCYQYYGLFSDYRIFLEGDYQVDNVIYRLFHFSVS